MPGLLGDSFEDPRSAAIMALSAGLLQRNAGAGLLGANAAYANARNDASKRQFVDMQVQNMQSEIDQRKAAIAKQAALQEYAKRFLGGGGTEPAAPGQMGSGSFGITPLAPGQPDMPAQRPGGLGGRSLEDVTAFHMMGGPDLTNAWKLAREGFERKAGSFYEGVNGGREYIPDPTKSIDFRNGKVSVLPGATDAQAALTLATEAPKTLLGSAGRLNLRPNADGTQSPVSELSENPTLQNILGGVFGQQGRPAPMQQAGPGHPVVSPADQRGADAEAIRIHQSELQNPNLSPADRAGVERDLARLTQAQTQPGFPAPSMIRNPQGYGMTTQQTTQAAADKEQAVQTAKDFAEHRKGIMNAGFVASGNIAKYQQIGRLLADVDGGKYTPMGTEFASALNGFGLKVDKNLPNKQAAMSLANEAALQLRSPAGGAGMPGAMSDSDRVFLASMTPNISQSAEGRKMVIDSYVAVQQRNAQVADFARKYEKKYGKLDNGFFDQLSAWSTSNPLFKAR